METHVLMEFRRSYESLLFLGLALSTSIGAAYAETTRCTSGRSDALHAVESGSSDCSGLERRREHIGGAAEDSLGVLKRVAPPGFKGARSGASLKLRYGASAVAGVRLLLDPDSGNQVQLDSTSAQRLSELLSSLGFDAAAAYAYSGDGVIALNESICLPLERWPDKCSTIVLSLPSNAVTPPALDVVELLVADAVIPLPQQDRLLAYAPPSIAGRINLYGAFSNSSRGGRGESASAGFSTSGIASNGPLRLEYDLFGKTESASFAKAKSKGVTFNTLAVAYEQRAGTSYIGLLPSGGVEVVSPGASDLFLTRRRHLGAAWHTSSVSFSGAQIPQEVSLRLPGPSLVTISSRGTVLYERQLNAGINSANFIGYGDRFVEVKVRDLSGNEQRSLEEAQKAVTPESGRRMRGRDPFGAYVDLGLPVESESVLGGPSSALQISKQLTGSAGFHFSRDHWSATFGGQFDGAGRRLALGLADSLYLHRGTLMVGSEGERGLSLATQLTIANSIRVPFNLTRYEAGARGDLVSNSFVSGFQAGCLVRTCLSNRSYRSMSTGISRAGLPWSITYYQRSSLSGVGNEQKQINIQGVFNPVLGGERLFVTLATSYDLTTKSASVNTSLVIPLERTGRFVSGGVSLSAGGETDVSAGLSSPGSVFSGNGGGSWSVAASQRFATGGNSQPVASGYLTERWGSWMTSHSAVLGNGTASVSSSFNTGYILGRGVGSLVSNGDAFGARPFSTGSTGIVLENMSNENHTAVIAGATHEVPAKTSVYIPQPAGRLQSLSVSPGPAQDLGRNVFLNKGNVHSVSIPSGIWVLASFRTIDGRAISPDYVVNNLSGRRERLYADRAGNSLLFEAIGLDVPKHRVVMSRSDSLAVGINYFCQSEEDLESYANGDSFYPAIGYKCTEVAAGKGR
jgi:hypothetical protein